MKIFTYALSSIVLFTSCNTKKTSYEDEIKLFQYELNTQFANAEESPLTEEDVKTFKALDFFKIEENYRVEASFKLTPGEPIFEMQTTTDRLPLYQKYGVASFTLNGKDCQLSLYQSQQYMTSLEHGNLLFLPYNDPSNGDASYGGGRFIDIEIPEKGSKKIVIDFNKSYNPYCAYNHKYSCPIPPSENNLNIEILAGVKAYKKHH
jgi:uncharacterized protein (DUF1684 family)